MRRWCKASRIGTRIQPIGRIYTDYLIMITDYPYSRNYFLVYLKWIIMKHEEITDQIIKAYYKVYNTLGFGFLERVYENALFIELKNIGLVVEKQKGISVFYDEEIVVIILQI